MQRRRYFHSTEEEYQSPQTTPQTYLYIYKHNFPEIILRFPSPLKTITGYRLYHAEIFYHPFYDQSDHQRSQQSGNHSQNSNQIERLELEYQGEIILNLENSIFNKYFQQEVLYLLKQQQAQVKESKKIIIKSNKKQKLQYSFHLSPDIYTHNNDHYSPIIQHQHSQMFQILLTEWLKDPQITTMSFVSEKHIKTFDSYDHGYIQLEILKTSNKTLKAPFHRYMKQRQWAQQQISNYYKTYQNKIYYFQYQAYILPTYHENFEDAQKLGFVMPNPITTNQFFYEVLLNMYNEFQAEQKKKQDMKKRKEEKIKTREALLENLRKIGVEGNIPDLNDSQDDKQTNRREDSLDKKLQELLSKKNKNQLSYIKVQPSFTEMHLSTLHNHNQSYLETSPRRRVSTKISEDQFKKEEQLSKRYRSPTLANVKVIRSFISELLEDDFEQKPKRRFITKKQYVKLLEFNRSLMAKKEQKQKRLHQEQNKTYLSPQKQNQQVVYLGLTQYQNKPKTQNKRGQFSSTNIKRYAYDYFGVHQETIIIGDQPLRKPMQYSWEQEEVDQSSVVDQEDQYDEQQVKQYQAQEPKIEEMIAPSDNISAGYQRQQCSSINSSLMYRVQKRLDNGNIVYYARY